jgi:hypothetical protein
MAFELLRHLQYGLGSDCGKDLRNYPSRVIPISFVNGLEICSLGLSDKKRIYYECVRLCENVILCDKNVLLPEPPVYFKGRHSLIKSYLYLSSVEFYNNCHLPKKSSEMVRIFLKKIFEKYGKKSTSSEIIKSRGAEKKLIQNLFLKGDEGIDTDPCENQYFQYIYDNLLDNCDSENKEAENKPFFLIVKSGDSGNYLKTLPEQIPDLISQKTKDKQKTCYIFLELPNHRFCPYGKSYF